ncbi:hypothetical protein niasHT_031171 [Heterodera trifolii]|uniref:Uncharacterized protein n=1 Tax=Heterodera trifolii TaxID=157864 RepID=A0ABD2IAP8_9BILA
MIIIIILFILFPLNFSFASGQLSPNFHLTNGHNGLKIVSYRASEQCETKGTNEKAFGIEFRFPKEGGYCDDGLLICYPSYLQSHPDKGNFQLKGTFIVGEGKDNHITNACDQMTEKTVKWHGIKVRTEPTNGPNSNGMRKTIFEASIVGQSIDLGVMNRSHFLLRFDGNSKDSFTVLSPQINDASFLAKNSESQTDYLANLKNSAFLGEFSGLWLLGLDMVPMTGQQTVQLHVNRSCNCAMEAWFIQPTDSNKTIDPKVPTVGSEACRPFFTDQTFPATGRISLLNFSFTALTDVEIPKITVKLLDENKKWLASFYIGENIIDASFKGDGKKYRNKLQMPKGSTLLRLNIIFPKKPFHGAVKVHLYDKLTVFNPSQKQKLKNYSVKWITIQGQLMLLREPAHL